MTLAIALAALAHAATAPKAKALRPLGQYRTWFSAKDYPQDAVVGRKQGNTGFELAIGTNGLPTDCRILSSSGTKSLDDRTCSIMMSRARFRPAIDRKGKPTTQVFRHAMVWKLPGKHEEKTVDRTFDAKSTIAATGEVTSCKLSGGGASKIASAGGSCGPFGNKDFFAFFLKDNYPKVRTANVRMTIAFNGAPAAPLDRPPNFLKEIAKSSIDIAPSGEMTGCTPVTKLEALGHTLDLCDFVRADPPRFPSAANARKAMLVLDLSANYN